tara:strand:+ start:3396 stop:3920 length:525 start_codon:yes stop_codon:yes gene_type:complete
MFYILIFLMIPVLEVIVFIQAGGAIGILNTLLLTILTAVIGMTLLRKQGFETLKKAQQKTNRGEAPLGEMFDGLCLFAAGLLLLTPGFVTDTVGFLLFLPPFRAVLRAYAKTLPISFFQQSGFSSEQMFRMERENTTRRPGSKQRQDRPKNDTPHGGGPVIDGDYKDVTDTDER